MISLSRKDMAAGRSPRLLFLFVFFLVLVAEAVAGNIPASTQSAKLNNANLDAGVMGREEKKQNMVWGWCVPASNEGLPNSAFQQILDFACRSAGVDCGPIQPGRECFEPNSVYVHAAYAMNAYFRHYGVCDFHGVGRLIHLDPSHGNCLWP